MLTDPSAQLRALGGILHQQNPQIYKPNSILRWSDLESVESRHIANAIHGMTSEFAPLAYDNMNRALIAPTDAVIRDFKKLRKTDKFHVVKRVDYDMDARAIQGHAHQGHGVFSKDKTYANTTTRSVVESLAQSKYTVAKKKAFSVTDFQNRSQEWIDEIVTVLDDVFENPAKYKQDVRLPSIKGRPFARMGWPKRST